MQFSRSVSWAVLLVVCAAGAVRANPTNYAEARALAAERNTSVLLEFYTDW